jgi:prolyl oligopeptidase
MLRVLIVLLMSLSLADCHGADPGKARVSYPATHKGDVVDNYGGIRIADPYRWMEALDSRDVVDWVKAQNAVTEPYLANLPLRKHFQDRLTQLWDYARVGMPQIEQGRLFYARNTGLQRQSPVFSRTSIDAPPALVIDPNAISEDGSLSLSQWRVSPDGKLLAYTMSEGGADWETAKVRDLAAGRDLSDDVQWMRFSDLSWTKDSKGFFYSRYPEPPKNKVLEAALADHALYYHRVGTHQSQDTLMYRRSGQR